MTVYTVVLFLHVVGALGLFVALGLEWNALTGLRSARTAEDARRSLGAYRALRVLGPVSLVLILVAGLYLTVTAAGWQGWNAVALAAMVLLFVLGAGSNATRLPRIGRAMGPRQGALPSEIRAVVRDPILWASMVTRAGLALGIVFIMTTKPDGAGALIAVALSTIAGVAVATLTSRAPAGQGTATGLERAS